jgi:hypothetical protein
VYPGNGQPQQNWGHQQYQGLGYFPQPGSEPPRGRGRMVVILAVVALVVIIGTVVTIVLVNRSSDEPQAQNPPTTSSSAPATPPSSKTTGKGTPGLQPRNPGWSVIKNERAALIYEVPPAWTPSPGGTVASKSVSDVVLSFPASLASYECEGKQFSRGGLGGGTLEKTDLNETATRLAKGLGEEFYGSASPAVQVGEPKQVTAKTTEGKAIKAVQVDAVITTSGNACMAEKGKVSALVLEGQESYSFLVVNIDLTGGPATPPPPDEAESQKIVDSVRGY